jgi:hypothetical protein
MTARPSERTNINAAGFYTGKPLEIDNNIITAITDIAGLVAAVLGKLKR